MSYSGSLGVLPSASLIKSGCMKVGNNDSAYAKNSSASLLNTFSTGSQNAGSASSSYFGFAF